MLVKKQTNKRPKSTKTTQQQQKKTESLAFKATNTENEEKKIAGNELTGHFRNLFQPSTDTVLFHNLWGFNNSEVIIILPHLQGGGRMSN